MTVKCARMNELTYLDFFSVLIVVKPLLKINQGFKIHDKGESRSELINRAQKNNIKHQTIELINSVLCKFYISQNNKMCRNRRQNLARHFETVQDLARERNCVTYDLHIVAK